MGISKTNSCIEEKQIDRFSQVQRLSEEKLPRKEMKSNGADMVYILKSLILYYTNINYIYFFVTGCKLLNLLLS